MNTKRLRWLAIGVVCGALSLAGCNGQSADWDPLGFLKGPKDDGTYTVLLYISDAPSHIEEVKYIRDATKKHTGWRDLIVIHQSDRSAMYWGSYATVEDAAKNRKVARNYHSEAGLRPFSAAIVVPMPGKEVGPPELKLGNTPGYYSLLVAVFYDMPERRYIGRKKFAVEYCQKLRKNGYESYYYHGPARSGVTIGSFPKSSVETKREGVKMKHIIHDARVTKLMGDFPRLAVNGSAERREVVNPKTGKVEKIVQKTYLIRIPRKEGSGGAGTLNRIGNPQQR